MKAICWQEMASDNATARTTITTARLMRPYTDVCVRERERRQQRIMSLEQETSVSSLKRFGFMLSRCCGWAEVNGFSGLVRWFGSNVGEATERLQRVKDLQK